MLALHAKASDTHDNVRKQIPEGEPYTAEDPAEHERNLPRAVVKIGVPRRPSAVEGKRQLLVMLVLLTPQPKRLEHFCASKNCKKRQHTKYVYGENMYS